MANARATITADEASPEFLKHLRDAANPGELVVMSEERLDGLQVGLQVLATLTPAIAYVLGVYYGKSKTPAKFTIKLAGGQEVTAEGDAVEKILGLLKPLSSPHDLPKPDEAS